MQFTQKFGRFCALSLLSLALSACGGGGGGDSSSSGGTAPVPVPGTPPGAFTVSINQSALNFSGEEGGSIQSVAVLGSGSGTLPAAIYLGSLDLGTAIQQVTVESIGTQVKFTVFPKTNLAAGQYTGNLQLFACPDEKCATHFAGSPASVPYKITVTKGFKVSPGELRLTAVSGATPSGKVAVQLKPGVASYSAEVVPGGEWLTVSDKTLEGFTVTAKAMRPGNYMAPVLVSADGVTRSVLVYYTVTGDANTILQPKPDVANLSMSATSTASASRRLNVTLPPWTQELDVGVQYLDNSSGWLSVAKVGASSLDVTAAAGALAPGSYRAQLILRSPGAQDTPVEVNFTVGAANWKIDGVSSFKVDGATTLAGLGGQLSVAMPDLPAQPYSIQTAAPWLKLSRTSGSTGDAPIRLNVDPAELNKLRNFQTHEAAVLVKAADTRIPSFTLKVTLDKALPELHYVSPHTRLPGEGGQFILRGRGLAGIANLAQTLQVSGAVPASLTRVGDTEVRVSLPAASSGAVGFSLVNGLGVPTGAPTLAVVPQGAYAYAAIPTGGAKGSLVFDPERQALYTANKTMQTVMKFAWNGSSWAVDSAPLPRAEGVALSPDGKQVLATATPGDVVLFDPGTLARQAAYKTSYIGGYELNSTPTLAMTNDGRAFFQGGRLSYFDLVSREFGRIDSPLYTSFQESWFSVSGDGSRLNVVQAADNSSMYPMLYLDSPDCTVKANPAGINFWFESAQSLRGERFVEGTYRVWDRDFTLIGNLALPSDSYFGRTPVVSPDGNRVYVMAYETGFSDVGSAVLPRVYVFDSSTRMVQSTNLPLLGYFDLADYPTCRSSAYECNTRALGAISPDGKTLFFVGDASLVVAPVPATLTPSVQRASMQRSSGSIAVTPRMTRVATGR